MEDKKINRTFLIIGLFFTVGFIAFIILINNWIKSALKEEAPAKVSEQLSLTSKTKTPLLEKIEPPVPNLSMKTPKKVPQEKTIQEPIVEQEPAPPVRRDFLVN